MHTLKRRPVFRKLDSSMLTRHVTYLLKDVFLVVDEVSGRADAEGELRVDRLRVDLVVAEVRLLHARRLRETRHTSLTMRLHVVGTRVRSWLNACQGHVHQLTDA